MTLQDIFNQIGENPLPITLFFVAIPLVTLLFTWIIKDEGSNSAWGYIYSILIFIACIPGIFALTLCVYNFLFLRRNLLEVNVLVYFLPIISMIVTIVLLNRVTELDRIPGFGKISGLLMTITAIISIMFFLDRTHIYAFVHIPVQYLLGIIVGMFILFRFGAKKLMSR